MICFFNSGLKTGASEFTVDTIACTGMLFILSNRARLFKYVLIAGDVTRKSATAPIVQSQTFSVNFPILNFTRAPALKYLFPITKSAI